MPGYLDKLLLPVKPYDSEEMDIRRDVEDGVASEEERSVVIEELEHLNWPKELAEKMTRESHPLEHGEDRD